MHESITQIIFNAIKNQEILLDMPIDISKGNETVIFGEDSLIDSMSLVSLILDVEAAIEREINRPLIIVSEKAMSSKNSPFATVGTLCEFICNELKEVN